MVAAEQPTTYNIGCKHEPGHAAVDPSNGSVARRTQAGDAGIAVVAAGNNGKTAPATRCMDTFIPDRAFSDDGRRGGHRARTLGCDNIASYSYRADAAHM